MPDSKIVIGVGRDIAKWAQRLGAGLLEDGCQKAIILDWHQAHLHPDAAYFFRYGYNRSKVLVGGIYQSETWNQPFTCFLPISRAVITDCARDIVPTVRKAVKESALAMEREGPPGSWAKAVGA